MLPMLMLFSLFLRPFRPVFLLDHPKATRHAIDTTQVPGESPKAGLGLSGEVIQPLDSIDTITGMLGLIVICCSTLENAKGWRGAVLLVDVVREAAMVARKCSILGDDVNDVLTVWGYGEGWPLARDLTRCCRNSDGNGP